MGWWANFKASARKSSELKRVSKILGAQPSFELAAILQQAGNQDKALDDLLNLIEADPTLTQIIRQYGATRGKLKRAYSTLCYVGGHWTRTGHWVPASAISFRTTLPYVLIHEDENDQSVWLEVVERLIQYFEKNETRPIPPVNVTGIIRRYP